MSAAPVSAPTGLLGRLQQRYPLRSVLLGLAAPVGAVLFAVLASSVILILGDNSPFTVFETMIRQAGRPTQFVDMVNQAMVYYLSAVAVSIGFRMNLFNIGVEGQYSLAALGAAYVGGQITGGGPFHLVAEVLVAMLVGAAWAGIAGVLRVFRGVSEVISTIMLNAIAVGLASYLLHKLGRASGNNIQTTPIGPSGQVPGLSYSGTQAKIFGFLFVAIAVGVAYWFIVTRTRFGFRIKATGLNEQAAIASGVNVKRMTLVAMLMSGGVAGLVGLPELLGSTHSFSQTSQSGLGFAGIAIALLGRNSPIGMAMAAVLWSFLGKSANQLDFIGVPREIAAIMQGMILLAVVIAYELVRRYRLVLQQKDVAAQLAAGPPDPTGPPAPAAQAVSA
ncbi:MAG TPA: ABC transporter permease [Jatrophihabitans sp.]|jgi:simple sugar transport system permease protein|uniref:ABC transporter permease n=1 Tax=Jatrophihabitans sp. TaxID=1932789 RepID=UPI002EE3C197